MKSLRSLLLLLSILLPSITHLSASLIAPAISVPLFLPHSTLTPSSTSSTETPPHSPFRGDDPISNLPNQIEPSSAFSSPSSSSISSPEQLLLGESKNQSIPIASSSFPSVPSSFLPPSSPSISQANVVRAPLMVRSPRVHLVYPADAPPISSSQPSSSSPSPSSGPEFQSFSDTLRTSTISPASISPISSFSLDSQFTPVSSLPTPSATSGTPSATSGTPSSPSVFTAPLSTSSLSSSTPSPRFSALVHELNPNDVSTLFAPSAFVAYSPPRCSVFPEPSPPGCVPDAPTITGLEPTTAGVYIYFTPPANANPDTPDAIIGYQIMSLGDGLIFISRGNPPPNPIGILGLNPGYSYSFKLRAQNNNGFGDASEASSTITIPSTYDTTTYGIILMSIVIASLSCCFLICVIRLLLKWRAHLSSLQSLSDLDQIEGVVYQQIEGSTGEQVEGICDDGVQQEGLSSERIEKDQEGIPLEGSAGQRLAQARERERKRKRREEVELALEQQQQQQQQLQDEDEMMRERLDSDEDM